MDFVRLSKSTAHALRHAPWLYELELDEEGWTPLSQLIEAFRDERREWRDLTEKVTVNLIDPGMLLRIHRGMCM